MNDRNKARYLIIIGMVLAALLLYIFGKIASELLEKELGHFDTVVYQEIWSFHSSWMTRVMLFITFFGSPLFLIIAGIGLFVHFRKVRGRYWDGVMTAANLLGSWGLNEVLKRTFHRLRPTVEHLTFVTGFSFPSGHAMVSFSFYVFVAYIIYRNGKRGKIHYGMVLFFILLPIGIGISRIYLGVHYASDVLAGFTAGAVWAIFCMMAHQMRISS